MNCVAGAKLLALFGILAALTLVSVVGHAQQLAAIEAFVEPDRGRGPLIDAFRDASQSIDMYIHRFCQSDGTCDGEILAALADATTPPRSVTIRVLLEPCPGEGVATCDGFAQAVLACEGLVSAGAAVKWASPGYPELPFQKTHAKSMLIDNSKALIVTLNPTPNTFDPPGRRDYGLIVTTDPDGVIRAFREVFVLDWRPDDPDDPALTAVEDCSAPPARTAVGASRTFPPLIVSPDTREVAPGSVRSFARDQILGLIRTATPQTPLRIHIEKIDREVDDPEILCTLLRRIRNDGVPVQVLLSPDETHNARVARAINAAGAPGQVRYQGADRPKLHAKMIMVGDQHVYVGSHNLTTKSLDQRREIGWVTTDGPTISRLRMTFDQDWDAGAVEQGTQASCGL